MHGPAGAGGAHLLVGNHLHAQGRQFKDLAGLCYLQAFLGQWQLAGAALAGRWVLHGLINLDALAQGATAVAGLATAFALPAHAQGLGCGFAQAVTGGRAAGVLAGLVQPGLQLLLLRLQLLVPQRELLDLLPQRQDQLVLLRMAQLA